MNQFESSGLPASSEGEMSSLRDWLGSAEAMSLMRKIAGDLRRYALRKQLSPDFIGLGCSLQEPGAEDALLSALAEFVLTHSSFQCRFRSLAETNRARFLLVSFLNHWRDRGNSSGGDPWRKYRKRVFDVLRADERFITRGDSGPAKFSMVEGSRTVQPLSEEDLKGVPTPAGLAFSGSGEARKRKVILRLAEHFWSFLSGAFGHPVWLEISSLASWIFIHSPDGRGKELPVDEPDAIPDERFRPDGFPLEAGLVEGFAETFSNRLTPRQREIFLYRNCRKATLSKTAEHMGIGSPQTVKNHQDRAEALLGDFCRELPWLSPEDLDSSAIELFFEKLCAILENAISTPSA